jgi:FKBP-type peptidyl-prolyl cis-trans isomerase FkpA
LYYQIIDSGNGARASSIDSIYFTYTAKLASTGAIIDQQTSVDTVNSRPLPLSYLILGFQIGIPLIEQGGHIKLVIPSAYGYGCNGATNANGATVVPPNSILYYDVTLVKVKKQ